MLEGFAAHTHGLGVLIEPRLRGLDDVFVFPAFDAALVGRCALIVFTQPGSKPEELKMSKKRQLYPVGRVTCYGVDSGAPPSSRCGLVNNAAAICGVLSMALTIDRKCGRRTQPRVVS